MKCALAVVVGVLAAGCTETATTTCGDGRTCPPGAVCDDLHAKCVLPEQLVTCDGQLDGTACAIGGAAVGVCRDEVCLISGCGDGFVVAPEQCDGENLGSATDCTSLDYYQPGTLSCANDCTFDKTEC